ncbi:MAG: response regulator transcription factor [Chitinophagales bacterium]|nr:response regulator transcription factor [Chitinophagales bacterium]
MPARLLLVDDEFLALRLLEDYAARLPGLEVVAKAKTALQAMEILASEPIDILFLDIQMPVLSGVNLLKALPRRPVTIFTTAYSEYALEAFDLNVVDYLLKPYSFERFVQAVNKALDALPKSVENAEILPENAYIVVKVDGRLEKIALEELLYVEGLREYVRLVCANKQYVTFERMKNIEERLPAAQFLRVHKSYIVAKKAVQSLEGNLLHVGKVKIPVSRERKEAVVGAIFGV